MRMGMNSHFVGIGLRFLTVTVVLASAGNVHGSGQTANQGPDAPGEYLLTSANSQELPALVSETATTKQEVIGGSVVLEADGSYVWTTRYRRTVGGGVHTSESSGRGTYSQQGARIIFMVEVGNDIYEGTLESNTLTIPVDVPMVYRKIFGQRPTEAFTEPVRAGGLPPPPSPPPSGVTFDLLLAPGSLPGSFEELCDSSILIVEAYVQSVLAPRQDLRYPSGTQLLQERSFPIFHYLETDAILRVSEVLKGPESIRQVVLSQKGGVLGSYTELPAQYDLMQRGKHYILFLADEARSDLPDVRGIPRYALNGAWTGMFRIDEGGVHMSPDTAEAIREQFDGRSSQDVITEIQRCSRTPAR